MTSKELAERIKQEGPKYEYFEQCIQEIQADKNLLLNLLEEVCTQKTYKKEDESKFIILYTKLKSENEEKLPSKIMGTLRGIAGKLNPEIKERLEKDIFRLISLTRKGERTEVMQYILKTYAICNEPVPYTLNLIFSPEYDLETFKCFMYTFLMNLN